MLLISLPFLASSDFLCYYCCVRCEKREKKFLPLFLFLRGSEVGTGGALGGRRRREYDVVLAGNLVFVFCFYGFMMNTENPSLSTSFPLLNVGFCFCMLKC